LPWGQDAVIDMVASVNPHTIVVLETGKPVSMPWLGKVKAIVQAWYPGQAGDQAIAEMLSGDEGAEVGYRWYTQKNEKPLYTFGRCPRRRLNASANACSVKVASRKWKSPAERGMGALTEKGCCGWAA
jgi:Glycosyl hydrolase family 3 C-terminal domain